MKKKIIILLSIILIITLILYINNNNKYYSEINYKSLEEKLNNKDSFVLCLTKTTCSHCSEYKPKLKEVANKYKVYIYYIELDKLTDKEKEQLNNNFSYNATPTTIFVKEGKETTAINRLEGNVSTSKIINKLKSNNFIN